MPGVPRLRAGAPGRRLHRLSAGEVEAGRGVRGAGACAPAAVLGKRVPGARQACTTRVAVWVSRSCGCCERGQRRSRASAGHQMHISLFGQRRRRRVSTRVAGRQGGAVCSLYRGMPCSGPRPGAWGARGRRGRRGVRMSWCWCVERGVRLDTPSLGLGYPRVQGGL